MEKRRRRKRGRRMRRRREEHEEEDREEDGDDETKKDVYSLKTYTILPQVQESQHQSQNPLPYESKREDGSFNSQQTEVVIENQPVVGNKQENSTRQKQQPSEVKNEHGQNLFPTEEAQASGTSHETPLRIKDESVNNEKAQAAFVEENQTRGIETVLISERNEALDGNDRVADVRGSEKESPISGNDHNQIIDSSGSLSESPAVSLLEEPGHNDPSNSVNSGLQIEISTEIRSDASKTKEAQEREVDDVVEKIAQVPARQTAELEGRSNVQVGDNCPVCLANSAEATFITSVKEQGEGLVTEQQVQQKQQQQQQKLLQQQHPQQVVEENQPLPPRTDGGFTDENMVPPVGNYGDVKVNNFVRPSMRQGQRASSAVPGRARFGLESQQTSVPPTSSMRRPQSAIDPSRFFVIEQPPSVVATGRAASMFSHNGGHFKTDFQQEREEAWKRTTRHGRQRPLTAIVQRSTSQFPPSQQPSFYNLDTKLQNPGIKITHTDHWLAGGRDLYWEGIRKRPKSGHTPGWMEGLPESMKRQRPRSALAASLTQPRSRLSQRPQSSTALIVSSYYKSPEHSSQREHGRNFSGGDIRYMLTYSHSQQQHQHLKPQLQISLQQQQQHQEHQLPLHPGLRQQDENPPPLSSPVSDAEGQEWVFPV
ncbi:Dnaj-like protein subfamily c member 14 [Plakobranchus ocellatus]|uniref:Dnaj-like protein subfamily c member 14 n=1 Tax=Plakobranchus ocellatus TaxID=259542 RepID=A0AAV4B686_9GAST|nr:Dnaj-like protein subfamily c member 14 [Plakobranchus ocellatus]